MTRRALPTLGLLTGLGLLAACTGVETGAVSPCHGQFRAEGAYFATREMADGATMVVSTKNPTDPGCAD